MKTIGLIPLDSRPCNTLWLEQLAKIAGYQLLMYPRNKCGDLFKAADFLDQIEWLKDNVRQMDYLLVSFDGLTSGGLVQTRVGNADLQLINANIQIFKELKNLRPGLKIFVFDVLMRTSITTSSLETAKYWSLVNEFSRLTGEIHFNNLDEDKQKLSEIKKEIPKFIIDSYLNARMKKNILNKLAIDLSKQAVIDYLIILQEDAMPNGIQKIEQFELIKLINDYKLNDRVKFYNGTDEGALLLYAKAILQDLDLSPSIYLHLPFAEALEKSMLFEDRPFRENLNLMFETINFKFSSLEAADFVLGIYTEAENYDLNLNTYKEVLPRFDNTFYDYFEQLNNLLIQKDTCFVDLLFPNGGSIEILNKINYKDLCCYSAWNTASNSVGTALAQIASVIVAKNKNLDYKHLNSNFLKERILDDCLYQYRIRRIVNEKLISKNINIYNLEASATKVLKEITKLLKELSKNYLVDDFSIKLPWNRTFEAEIIIEGEKDEAL